jgi:hypothetical protein
MDVGECTIGVAWPIPALHATPVILSGLAMEKLTMTRPCKRRKIKWYVRV